MSSKKPLRIEICNPNDDYIVVSNNLQPKIGDTDSSGHGLELLRKRYELLKTTEGMLVEQTAEHFTVRLKL